MCIIFAMKTVADRLQIILDETGLKDGSLAAKTNGVITQQGVNKIRRGITKSPSGDVLAALAKAAGYRVEWLVSGKGAKTDREAVPSQQTLDAHQERVLLAGIKEGLRLAGLIPGSAEWHRKVADAYDKARAELLAEGEDVG